MLREEINDASKKIVAALVDSGVREALKNLRLAMRSDSLRQKYSELLTAYGRYSALASEFGDNEKRISKALELDELLNAEFWSSVVSSQRIDAQLAQRLFAISNRVIFAIEHFPLFLDTLQPDYIDPSEDGKLETHHAGKALLRVTLPEKEYGLSIPGRITQMLDSINLMYSACAMLEDKKEDELVVAGCDSGSDKSFDFLGDANVVAAVKHILLSMWDRIVLMRTMDIAMRNRSIAQTLPINDTLEEMENSGDYEREYIAVLRNKLNKSVTMFAMCGATLPEFEQEKLHEPRNLLQPEVKLLAAPQTEELTATLSDESVKDAEPELQEPEVQENVQNEEPSDSDVETPNVSPSSAVAAASVAVFPLENSDNDDVERESDSEVAQDEVAEENTVSEENDEDTSNDESTDEVSADELSESRSPENLDEQVEENAIDADDTIPTLSVTAPKAAEVANESSDDDDSDDEAIDAEASLEDAETTAESEIVNIEPESSDDASPSPDDSEPAQNDDSKVTSIRPLEISGMESEEPTQDPETEEAAAIETREDESADESDEESDEDQDPVEIELASDALDSADEDEDDDDGDEDELDQTLMIDSDEDLDGILDAAAAQIQADANDKNDAGAVQSDGQESEPPKASVEDDIAAINKILGGDQPTGKDYWSKVRSKI